jgi:calmodulin
MDNTDQLQNEIKESFAFFDKDGDGSITFHEFAVAMKVLGQNPTENELLELIENVDENKNGSIEYKEFVTLVTEKPIAMEGVEEL